MKVLLSTPWQNRWKQSLLDAFLKRGHDAKWQEDICEIDDGYDVFFSMWANEVAVVASNEFKGDFYTYIRSYETGFDFPEKINWTNTKGIFYCSPDVKWQANLKYNSLIRSVPQYVVPNWLNCSEFPFKQREAGTDIAMVCNLYYKKNLPLAMYIMAELAQEYTLHIAGQNADDLIMFYCDTIMKELGLEDRVFFYGHIDPSDVPDFLDDKQYILSSSIKEGCPMNILEGMALGLKPVIHTWPGARGLFPSKFLFKTPKDGAQLITDIAYNSNEYRAFVEQYHGLNLADKVVSIIEETSCEN